MGGCSRGLAVAVTLIAAASAAAGAALAADAPEAHGRSGTIVIGLPAGDAPVSFGFGDGMITVDVPRGAAFPVDFQKESGGLLRSSEVRAVGSDRLKLELRLASGFVDGVDVNPSSVVLHLRSLFSDVLAAPEGADRYRLGPQDKVQISVNGEPNMTQQVVVGADGRISVPLVGDVTVGGLTVPEAVARVTEALARDYLVDPKVDLQVVEYRSHWVMATGEVGKPGRVPLRGRDTLKDVLSEADGLTPNAGDEIVISREAPDGHGRQQISVERAAFERAETNPILQSGDIVNIPARPYVYVNGQVRSPGRVPLERGMTLLKAISIAGGLNEWANEKNVQILSEGDKDGSRIFNLHDIERAKVPDPPLKGGDVIIVKKRFL